MTNERKSAIIIGMRKRVKSSAREEFAEKKERIPVYTASYKAARSDTLLEFLLRKCNTSRNNVKSLLTRRLVLVNGSVVTQYDFPLAKDDEVKISKTPVEGAKTAVRTVVPKKPKIEILFENEDFIAVNKPCGLLSVESDKERECAFSYVFSYLQSKGKQIRPFVLHRIDKETSGVLVFAKNVKLHSMMRMRWNDLVTLREYYAVVEGELAEKEGTLVHYLKEDQNGLMHATSDPSGQKAVTNYSVLYSDGEKSLLRVNIESGRKNQIRVQMHKIGHPVVGDEKYGHTLNPLGRLGLHASKIEFLHPVTKEILSFNAPLPPSFRFKD